MRIAFDLDGILIEENESFLLGKPIDESLSRENLC